MAASALGSSSEPRSGCHATRAAEMAKQQSFLFQWRKAIVESGLFLGPTARLVAFVLSLHMDADGGSCYPSLDTLAWETGLHRRTVIRQLAELELEGWIRVEHGGSPRGGRKEPNRYAAAIPSWHVE